MTGIAELHAQALDATGRILRVVPADCWPAATRRRPGRAQRTERSVPARPCHRML